MSKTDTAHPTWLLFAADTGDKGAASRAASQLLGRVENGNGTASRRDHGTVRKADPLALVLAEQAVAHGPIVGFILAPGRVDLSGEFRGSCSVRLFMRHPSETWTILTAILLLERMIE